MNKRDEVDFGFRLGSCPSVPLNVEEFQRSGIFSLLTIVMHGFYSKSHKSQAMASGEHRRR